MPDVVLFQPRKGLRAEANLADFIRYARHELAVFGADLDWESPRWELRGVANVSGRQKTLRVAWGHPLKKSPSSVGDYAPLDPLNVDFFKAYLRYRYGIAPQMNPLHMLSAMRHLDKALARAGKSIADALCDDFNVAATACRSAYSRETAYRVGRQLEAIARFLDDHELVAHPLAWSCHIRRPTHFHHLGAERDRRRDRKLPSQRAIAALGEAYLRARDGGYRAAALDVLRQHAGVLDEPAALLRPGPRSGHRRRLGHRTAGGCLTADRRTPGVSRGRRRVKPLRGSSASLRPFG